MMMIAKINASKISTMNPIIHASPPPPPPPPPPPLPLPSLPPLQLRPSSAVVAPTKALGRKPDRPIAPAAAVAVAAAEVIPPCSECGRRFPSWKALFGHMRCHPERQWRGINPPPQFRHRVACADADADAFEFTEEEREVAASLVMLAGRRRGRRRRRRPHDPRRRDCCSRCSEEHKIRCNSDQGEDGVCTHSKACVIDLNMPPPPLSPRVESGEGVSTTILDLRLGI